MDAALLVRPAYAAQLWICVLKFMNLKHTNCQNKNLAAIRDIDVLSILLQTEVSQENGLTKIATRTSPFCRSVKASYAPIIVKRKWGGGSGHLQEFDCKVCSRVGILIVCDQGSKDI